MREMRDERIRKGFEKLLPKKRDGLNNDQIADAAIAHMRETRLGEFLIEVMRPAYRVTAGS